jgi:uncharacterized membrane protein YphA (DoxX/SURF4 family)
MFKNLKKIEIFYCALIILLAVFFFISGYWEITKNPATYPKTLEMGYPPYFITALGIAKLCGVVALIMPKIKHLKEWAIAGFTFDVIFAFISGWAIESYTDSAKAAAVFGVLMLTYFLFRKIYSNQIT